MRRLRQYTPETLPKDIKRQLYKLNFGDEGMMRHFLVLPLHGDRYYVLADGDRVVGWAMTTLRRGRGRWRIKREAHYYVRLRERGQKYGLRLARAVYKREGKTKAYTRLFKGMNTTSA